MMTHTLNWKGTADGLAALDIVRNEIPQIKICLFGVYNPDYTADFIASPNRSEVADIMRNSSVFVCSSWEEGFGMPGLEAIACGAALATTDTKGSRDYAIHNSTALVSIPRAPKKLAENILIFLRNRNLLKSLSGNARALLQKYPLSWDDSAREFIKALKTL